MIKNINDIISIAVLIVLLIASMKIFAWAFFKNDDESNEKVSKWQLIKNYIDNVEE